MSKAVMETQFDTLNLMHRGKVRDLYDLGDAILIGISSGDSMHTQIGIGMWLGTIMWFNVWFIIWPNQKIALGIDGAEGDKAKAGRTGTVICEKCVALLGPLGYSRDWLVEKWMRDCKITDIFEGTGQINTLIVARNILGFNRDMLK